MAVPTGARTAAPHTDRVAALTDVDVRSSRDGAALRRCTALDLGRFSAEVWGRQASLSRSADLGHGRFTDLLTLDDVDDLLSRRGLRTPFLRVARDGRTVPSGGFTRGGGVGATIADQVADDRLARLFTSGSTLVLQGLHRTHGPLLDFARELSADLGHPVQMNAYVTPPQNRGFDAHYDTHDVFVLQVAGRKRWVVHRPTAPLPTPSMPWTDHRDDVTAATQVDPQLDVTLEPGDALYLPRGYVHAASALGGVSAHITVGIHPWTRRHVADEILSGLSAALPLRESLPLGIDVASPDEVDAPARDVLDAVIAHLTALRDDPALGRRVAGGLRAAADAAVRAEPVAPMRQQAALAALAENSVLRWRRGLAADVTTEGDTVVVATTEVTVRLPAGAEPGLSLLLAGEPVAAGQLGPDLAAAETLLREALAVPAEP